VSQTSAASRPATETVLVVENESAIRTLVQMALERHGYRVLAAGSGADALEISNGHQGRIDLLITDVVIPDMNGPEIARQLAVSRPNLSTLFMSGYMDDSLTDHGLRAGHVDFIQKPFSPRVLAERVREILDRARAADQKSS
jgi:two-component system, cell cycle sensor histidine kinase and response regulator CckA